MASFMIDPGRWMLMPKITGDGSSKFVAADHGVPIRVAIQPYRP